MLPNSQITGTAVGAGFHQTSDLYLGAGYSFCDEKLRTELEEFYRQHPFEDKEREEKRTPERISDCIALRNQQQDRLSAWLQQNRKSTNGLSAVGAKR